MAILNIWVSLMAKLGIVLVAQSCLTLCNPTDCSLPGFSVLEVLQARILEWIVIPFSRGTSQPRIEPWSPASQADSLPFELGINDAF